jgi:hypothetical protein
VPSHERAGVQVGFDYIMWLLRERKITRQTEGLVARSLMRLAMFLYHSESKVRRQGFLVFSFWSCHVKVMHASPEELLYHSEFEGWSQKFLTRNVFSILMVLA